MFSQQREIRNLVAQLADGLLLGAALGLAHAVRTLLGNLTWGNLPRIGTFDRFVPLLVFVVILGPLILDSCSIYCRSLAKRPSDFLFRLAQALLLMLLVNALLVFMFKLEEVARGVVLLSAGFGFLLVAIRHFLLADTLDFFFQGKAPPSGVLLVGAPGHLAALRAQIARQDEVNLSIAGEVSSFDHLEITVADWLQKEPISAVIFRVPHSVFEEVQKAVAVCETQGVEAWLLSDALEPRLSVVRFETFLGHPTILFSARQPPLWQFLAKRLLDLVVSGIGLVACAPIAALIALAIRLESRGLIYFVQERSGLRGRVFRMFKFRSMVSNADMLRDDLAAFNEMSGPVFKIGKDPRVTRVGALLRRTSLDELPQLWNVFKGDMSLVGPRPLPVYETRQISQLQHRRRLSVKPGLTCLWQISGRNQIRSFDEWARLDLEYVDHWSFWLDLKILLKTIPVVLKGAGAR
ncbi:MAG: sugar transferase [Verrucomicrobiae bacterium]|nr:sugar transferase [Verrucomicrobiae bacterium]